MSFSMAVHSKASRAALRSRRIGWASRERMGAAGQTTAGPGQASQRGALPRSLRQGGAPQDRALYSCGCGYAFDALVSTSVDCPQCGDRQAW